MTDDEDVPKFGLGLITEWDLHRDGSGVIFAVTGYPSDRTIALAVVDLAQKCGWEPRTGDAEILEKVRAGELQDDTDDAAIWSDIYEEAEDWLNYQVCPDGYMFGFSNHGNFMLLSDEAWCERAQWPCHDPKHKHPAPDGEWVGEEY